MSDGCSQSSRPVSHSRVTCSTMLSASGPVIWQSPLDRKLASLPGVISRRHKIVASQFARKFIEILVQTASDELGQKPVVFRVKMLGKRIGAISRQLTHSVKGHQRQCKGTALDAVVCASFFFEIPEPT